MWPVLHPVCLDLVLTGQDLVPKIKSHQRDLKDVERSQCKCTGVQVTPELFLRMQPCKYSPITRSCALMQPAALIEPVVHHFDVTILVLL